MGKGNSANVKLGHAWATYKKNNLSKINSYQQAHKGLQLNAIKFMNLKREGKDAKISDVFIKKR
jgi:serine protease inhibitor ecotin